MNNAIIRTETGIKDFNIDFTYHPLPLTKKLKSVERNADGIVAAFFFTIGFSFIPASIITFIVKERNDMVKH